MWTSTCSKWKYLARKLFHIFLFLLFAISRLSDSYSIGISSVKTGFERKIQFLRKKIQALDSDIVQLMSQKKNEIQRQTNPTEDDATLERIDSEIEEKKKAKIPHIQSLEELEKYISTDTFRMNAKILVYKDENAMLFESNDTFSVYGGYVESASEFTEESCLNNDYCVVVRERVKSYRRGSRRLEKTSTKYFVVYKALKKVPINPKHLPFDDSDEEESPSKKSIVPRSPLCFITSELPLQWGSQIILWGNHFVFFGPIIFYKGEVVVDPSFTSITVPDPLIKKFFLGPNFLARFCAYKSVSNDNIVKYLLCEKRGEFWLPSKSKLFPKEFNECMLFILLAHQMSSNEYSLISEDVFKFCILPFLPVNDVFWNSPLNSLLQIERMFYPTSSILSNYSEFYEDCGGIIQIQEDFFRSVPDFLQGVKDSVLMDFILPKAKSTGSNESEELFPERISSILSGMDTVYKYLYDEADSFLRTMQYMMQFAVEDRSANLVLIQPKDKMKILSSVLLNEFDSLVTHSVSFAIAVISKSRLKNLILMSGDPGGDLLSILYNYRYILSAAMRLIVRCCRYHYRCFDRVVPLLMDEARFKLFAEDVMKSFHICTTLIFGESHIPLSGSFVTRNMFLCMRIDFVPMLRGMLSEAIDNKQVDPWKVLMMWLSSDPMKCLLFAHYGESPVKSKEQLKVVEVLDVLKELEMFPVSCDRGLGIRVMVELLMEYRRNLPIVDSDYVNHKTFDMYDYVNSCFEWGENMEIGTKILHKIQLWTLLANPGSHSIQFLCMPESSLVDNEYQKWVVKVFGIAKIRVLYKLKYRPLTIKRLRNRITDIAGKAQDILSKCAMSGVLCSAGEMRFVMTAIRALRDNVKFVDLENFINEYRAEEWSSEVEYGTLMIDDKPLEQWMLQSRLDFKNVLLRIIELFVHFPRTIHIARIFVDIHPRRDDILEFNVESLAVIETFFEGAFDIVRSVEDVYPPAFGRFTHSLLDLWNSISVKSIVEHGSPTTSFYRSKIFYFSVSKIVQWIWSVFPIYSHMSTTKFQQSFGSDTYIQTNPIHGLFFKERVLSCSIKGPFVDRAKNGTLFGIVVPKAGLAKAFARSSPNSHEELYTLSFPLWEIFRFVAFQTMRSLADEMQKDAEKFFDAAVSLFKNDTLFNGLFDNEKLCSELLQKTNERTFITIKLLQFVILHRCCHTRRKYDEWSKTGCDFVIQALFQSNFWNTVQGHCKVLHELPLHGYQQIYSDLFRSLENDFVIESRLMLLDSVLTLSLAQGPKRASRYFSDLIDHDQFFRMLVIGGGSEVALHVERVVELLSSFVINGVLNIPYEIIILQILSSSLRVSSPALVSRGYQAWFTCIESLVNILSHRCDFIMESYKKKSNFGKRVLSLSSVLSACVKLIGILWKSQKPASGTSLLKSEKSISPRYSSDPEGEERLITLLISLTSNFFSFLERNIIEDKKKEEEINGFDFNPDVIEKQAICYISKDINGCLVKYSMLLLHRIRFLESRSEYENELAATLHYLDICEAQMKWFESMYNPQDNIPSIDECTFCNRNGFIPFFEAIFHQHRAGIIKKLGPAIYRTILNRSLEVCAARFSCKESVRKSMPQSTILALISSKGLEGTELLKTVKLYLKDADLESLRLLIDQYEVLPFLRSDLGEDYVNASEELKRLYTEKSGFKFGGSEFEFDSSFSKSMESSLTNVDAAPLVPPSILSVEKQTNFLFNGIQHTEATFVIVPEMEGEAKARGIEGNIFSLSVLDSLETPKIEKVSENEGKRSNNIMKHDERMEIENDKGNGVEPNIFSLFSLDFGETSSQPVQDDDSNENEAKEEEQVKVNGRMFERKNRNLSGESIFGNLDNLPSEFTPPTTVSPNLDISFDEASLISDMSEFGDFGAGAERNINGMNVENGNLEPTKEFSFTLNTFGVNESSSEEEEENMNKKYGEQE